MLDGKKIGFDKVIGMIDEMMANLKTEQGDDDAKKEYCEKELDISEDKKKELELAVSDSETAIEDMQASLAKVVSEIAALTDSIKKLDASVAEATAQRKEDHDEFE